MMMLNAITDLFYCLMNWIFETYAFFVYSFEKKDKFCQF
jgi:hypothetical protein